MYELYHHGILGMHWGIRRYQNEDGSLTPRGKARLDKKDAKWARKNYDKIYKKTYKKSEKELRNYMKYDLNQRVRMRNANGKISMQYTNEYNRKLAELMNKNVSDLRAPSGKVVQFVAKRGEIGVHMALADQGYDMSQMKNGVYGSGKVAYKKKVIDRV